MVARVAQREKPFQTRHAKGAELAEKARKKNELTVVRSGAQPRRALDEEPARKPGFALIPSGDTQARRKARRLGFQLVTDPVDFVRKVSRASKQQKGVVVLTPPPPTPMMI